MNKKYLAALSISAVILTASISGIGEAPELSEQTQTTVDIENTAKSPFSEYVVQSGDTLSGIAREHAIDVNSLAYANGMNINTTLRVGKPMVIPAVSGAVHTVKRGDTLWDVARGYGATVAAIIEANPQVNASALKLNEKLLIPGVKPHSPAVRLPSPSATGSAFAWPAAGRITSAFGPRWGAFHAGLDLGVNTGTSVKAASGGTVTFSGNGGGYGLLVKISHANGYETRYAHNSKLLVKAGDKVTTGQVIALSGNTGNSTGPHLHFEVRKAGVALNPVNYLR